MRRLAALLFVASLAACSTAPGSMPVADAGPGEDAGPSEDAGSGGAGGAPVVKRTIEQRNPFGNVAETENLLWDGDFEWYSAFADQYGWLEGPSTLAIGYTFKDIRLGAACRSGVKCAGMAKGSVLAGVAVASQGKKLEASFWAHVVKGACSGVKAYVIAMLGVGDPQVPIPPVDGAPDAGGWCHYDAVIAPRTVKPVLLIENKTGGDVVVDDAVVKAVPSEMKLSSPHGPLTAEEDADLAAARASLARLRGPHDAPPGAARRAVDAVRAR